MKNNKKIQRLEIKNQEPDVFGQGDFLTVSRRQVRNLYENGEHSTWYNVETAYPPFLDAVVLVLYAVTSENEPQILLRKGARPATAFRSSEPRLRQLDGDIFKGPLWELPAGGVEPQDLSENGNGLKGRAVLEAFEEGGFTLSEKNLTSLGPAPFSAPAFCTERLHYYTALVDPLTASIPKGDGHPMEEGAETVFLNLSQAILWCKQGKIIDLKSEVGLCRFKDWWEMR